MWPMLGSLFTGGASLLGSLFSSNTSNENNQANIQMQQQTNAMNVAENQKNRDFQESMSSTAYQRASQDMQTAGLNPMMMFGSGSAASSPSGGVPNLQAPKREQTSPLANLGDAASKAVSSAVAFKTMDKMSDEMANLEAENYRIRETTKNIAQSTKTETERTRGTRLSADETGERRDERKRDIPRQEWEAIRHLDYSGIPDAARKAGNIGAWGGGKVSDTISPLLNGAMSVKRLLPQRSSTQRSRVDSDGKSFDEFWDKRTGF